MPATSIALVALSDQTLADAEAVAAEIGRLAPDSPAPRVASRTAGAFTLAWDDGATANVTLVDKPIPWERLKGPCATAWYWPEAEAALRPHVAHLFVTLLDDTKRAIDVSFRLTRLTVAVTKNAPSLGIVWGGSGAVHEPTAFASLAAQSSASDLPLNLWIDFRVYELEADEGYGLFTTGLAALGRLEMEVPHYHGDPQKLVGAAYNIAHYVLERDATLKDTEVIGLPDESQVTICEDQSMIDPEQDVVRLEFS
ncbi:hypothetical protein Pla108_12630 [Botrimarina colliarenosi]|uniref:DUF4261 domain-containing protein n=1 Tax=Botrimarina colliarenosi TaxID=2528001 RepID=A0A5C6AQ39_9BACT|nr:DUF4261 domain-containing protein [Botrimarina colliarenosi]TWU00314.1 hypothetical protein Pla108_12630 [Botrimarina colliarenosi]